MAMAPSMYQGGFDDYSPQVVLKIFQQARSHREFHGPIFMSGELGMDVTNVVLGDSTKDIGQNVTFAGGAAYPNPEVTNFSLFGVETGGPCVWLPALPMMYMHWRHLIVPRDLSEHDLYMVDGGDPAEIPFYASNIVETKLLLNTMNPTSSVPGAPIQSLLEAYVPHGTFYANNNMFTSIDLDGDGTTGWTLLDSGVPSGYIAAYRMINTETHSPRVGHNVAFSKANLYGSDYWRLHFYGKNNRPGGGAPGIAPVRVYSELIDYFALTSGIEGFQYYNQFSKQQTGMTPRDSV